MNIFNSMHYHYMKIIQMLKKIHCRYIQISVYLILILCLSPIDVNNLNRCSLTISMSMVLIFNITIIDIYSKFVFKNSM